MADSKDKGCSGKRIYYSKSEAKSKAKKLLGLGFHNHPYKCKYCPGWHLTSRLPPTKNTNGVTS